MKQSAVLVAAVLTLATGAWAASNLNLSKSNINRLQRLSTPVTASADISGDRPTLVYRTPDNADFVLTQVCNGGVGGLFPFGYAENRPWEDMGVVSHIGQPFPHSEAWNLDDQFAHSDIIVLVVDAKCDDVFAGRQRTGQVAERFGLGINDSILWENRPPFSGIHRYLCLIQCRRRVRRLDSNPYSSFINAFVLHRDPRRRIVDQEWTAFELAVHR